MIKCPGDLQYPSIHALVLLSIFCALFTIVYLQRQEIHFWKNFSKNESKSVSWLAVY